MLGYVDSHCHICSSEFNDDIEEVIKRAKGNNVVRMMIICCDMDEVEKAIALKKQDDCFDIACGIHPEDQKIYSENSWERFLEYSKSDYISAIGEIGLDYYWNNDNKDEQKELFIKQIEIARSLNKPIIVHSRDAMQDTFEILKNHKIKGVLHSYSGSEEMAKEFVKLGYYISLGGPVTFKNAQKPKDVAKSVPLDKLLIETDSPYLTPVPFRGKRNEPSYVRYTGDYISEIRGIDIAGLQEAVCKNYDELFRKCQ